MMTYITQSVSSQSLSFTPTTAKHNNNGGSLKNQSSSRCSQRKRRQKEMRFVGRERSFQIILARTLFASFYVCSCGVMRRERLKSTFEGKSRRESFQKSPQNAHNVGAYSRTTEGYLKHAQQQNTFSPSLLEMIVKNVQFKWGKEIYAVDVDTSLPGSHLKTQLFSLTSVPPDRIKIMGLKGGKTINDETDLNAVSYTHLTLPTILRV